METSQEHINKVKEIQWITESIRSKISVGNGQDIVAFIGPAKSGKSTLINCLLGNPLETKYDSGTEETSIVRKTGGLGPTIGNTESFIPQQYSKFPDSDWYMVDFPGFGNFTRAEQEIASALAYAEVMRSQKSVRFVLVVPSGMIKSPNPMEFYKLLNNLVTLCPNLSGSFCIVATKSDNTSITSYLRKAMKLPFSRANEENAEIINIAQLAIKHVLQLEHCINFKEPVGKIDKNFTPPNLQEIVNLICSLKGKKIVTETPVSISDHSKLRLVELSTAIESQLRNEIKNIYKYFDTQELIRNQYSKLGELLKIIDYLEKSNDYDSFIKEITKRDFNKLPLIDNLKAITYVQLIMKNFRIGSCWNRQDEDEIFKAICTAIRHIANKNKNLKVETIINTNEFKKRRAETAEENSERDKKMKHNENPKYSNHEERSLEKRLKGTYEEIEQIQCNKNESDSEPMGKRSHTVPISMNYSQTSDDMKAKDLVIQPQTPLEIKLLISQMGQEGVSSGKCANCECEEYKPIKLNKNESHSEPIRNASINNLPTSDDIKDQYLVIQPPSPIEIKLLISQMSLNENKLNSEPIRNASHTVPISAKNSQTSDDISDKHWIIQPQSPIEIKLIISQSPQCRSQEGGSLEKRVNRNELSSEPPKKASQTSDDVKGNSRQSPYKNPLQVEEPSMRPHRTKVPRPVGKYYNTDWFIDEQTKRNENKPNSEPIENESNPGQNSTKNSQTIDDVKENSSPYNGFQAGDNSNYLNAEWLKNKRMKDNKNELNWGQNSKKTSDHEKRKSKSSMGKRLSIRGRRKKENDDEMEVRIERRQSNGRRQKDECNIL